MHAIDLPRRDWRQTTALKLKAQHEAIALFTDVRDETAVEICAIDNLTDLVSKLAAREWSSEQVTKAYISRAIKAHEKTNCLTEILFQEALEHAKELDRRLEAEGKVVGPFHGVPMTLKDQFNVTGHDTTLGYSGRALRPAESDAVLVKTLRRLGAVIIAKTNLPQSIMWSETDNPLWGLTTNPVNPAYTPGGSTGGESALLSLNGSMIGWGTDIGGSIRIPAYMMGLYGLKPSSLRLPYFGVPVSTEGQEHVHSSVGPLARSLSTIKIVFEQLVRNEPWKVDSRCIPLPWNETSYSGTLSQELTIGVLLDDGVVRPHPPITRVAQNAAAILEKAGHELVTWDTSLHTECIEVMDLFYTADGGEDIRRDVCAGGEPFIPHVEKLVNRGEAISVYDYWQLNKRKIALRQAYLEKWNNLRSPKTGKQADVLLMPVMPHSSVPHGGCRWVGYTKVWNFLDYTAMTIPGGVVEAADCAAVWNHERRNEMDQWNASIWEDNKEDMAEMRLPVGVQIVGRGLEEEKVLAVAQILDSLLKERS